MIRDIVNSAAITDTIRWMVQVLHDVTAHARTQGSRRNALASLGWLIGLLLPAMIVSVSLDLPTPFVVILVIAFGLVLVLFVAAYIYFMLKNPDALRSEKYVISKMVIDKGLVGDDLIGLIAASDTSRHPRLPSSGQPESGAES